MGGELPLITLNISISGKRKFGLRIVIKLSFPSNSSNVKSLFLDGSYSSLM